MSNLRNSSTPFIAFRLPSIENEQENEQASGQARSHRHGADDEAEQEAELTDGDDDSDEDAEVDSDSDCEAGDNAAEDDIGTKAVHSFSSFLAGQHEARKYLVVAAYHQHVKALEATTSATSNERREIKMTAYARAAELTGAGVSSVRRWVKEYTDTDGKLAVSKRGKHSKRATPITDPQFCAIVRAFIRGNAIQTGKPNLRLSSFVQWLNTVMIPDFIADDGKTGRSTVSEETGRRWLHRLGFRQKRYRKGIFVDGHDREDVVSARIAFVKDLVENILPRTHRYLDKKGKTSTDDVEDMAARDNIPMGGYVHPSVNRPIVLVWQDESTFAVNDSENSFWGDETMSGAGHAKKSEGQKIMVSGFITEEKGFLRLTDAEYAGYKKDNPLGTMKQSGVTYLEIGKNQDGYWTNDSFKKSLLENIEIGEYMFPNCQLVFMLDHSGNHRKQPEDALSVDKMSLTDNTKTQPMMHDTTFVDANGLTVTQAIGKKGLLTVCKERGLLDESKLGTYKKKDLQDILQRQADFAAENVVPIVETTVAKHPGGHVVKWIPKYHCELNPIELVWNRMKKYARKHCGYSIHHLRDTIPKALDSVPLVLIRRFARLCRDYSRAYHEGCKEGCIAAAHKTYKSHRRVFGTTLQELTGVRFDEAMLAD